MKNTMQKKLAALCIVFLVAGLVPAQRAGAAENFGLNRSSVILYLNKGINDSTNGGKTGNIQTFDFNLDKNKRPTDWKTAYSYEWGSKNKKIATVDKVGLVTPVAVGGTEITCKITNKKTKKVVQTLSAKVTVKANVFGVEITNRAKYDGKELTVGDSVDLNRCMYDLHGDVTTKKGVLVTDLTRWVAIDTYNGENAGSAVKINQSNGVYQFLEEGRYALYCETYQSSKYQKTTAESTAVYVTVRGKESEDGTEGIDTKDSSITALRTNTGMDFYVSAAGQYANWEGVSNVAQFAGADGQYMFAYDNGKNIVVMELKDGKVQEKVTLEKKHPVFGTVLCDAQGNYFVVTGEENDTTDTSVNTVFISKYDAKGKHVRTVGDNGSAGLPDYFSKDFYTKNPFHAGNCSAVINGTTLVVNYAREMYSGHQSNTVWAVDTSSLVNMDDLFGHYNSHSFAQRAVAYEDGFLLASEGDCYPRAFTVDISGGGIDRKTVDIFHFWVRKNALTDGDMFAVNNNFAHMGDVVVLSANRAALVASSARALDKSAATQEEQIFVQLFDPTKDLESKSAFITSGERSGMAGPDGNVATKDYGVKWLTSYTDGKVEAVQAVAVGTDKLLILYELSGAGKYGVYYMILDSEGNVVKDGTLLKRDALLNSCRTPVCIGNTVYWTANKVGTDRNELYVYQMTLK